MTNTLERAAQLTRERRNHAATEYDALLQRLAAGGDELPELIVTVTESAGYTLDELQEHVARLEALAAAREQIKGLPQIEERLREIEAERAALRAEIAAVQRRVAARDEQLSAELNSTTAALSRLQEVQRQILVGKFDLPSQAAKRAEENRVVARYGMQANNLRSELERERRKLSALESPALAFAQRRVAAIECELRPIEQALAGPVA